MSQTERKKAILLVEDEETLAVGLQFNLKAESYDVTWVKDGRQALEEVGIKEFDLIILDIMLPFVDGFEVAKKIRQKDPQLPILMLTALSEVQDRVQGLEIGADDYLTKPFHLEELLARIKGILRRKEWYRTTGPLSTYRFGNNEVNFERLTFKTGKKERTLTQLEAQLLKYFIENKGKVVSRKEILENVWKICPHDVETRTVDNFVARLRKYFEPNPENPVHFKSVRGVGYIFED